MRRDQRQKPPALIFFPRTPGDARRIIAEIGVGLAPAVLADLTLLVSEVVTNGLRYGCTGQSDQVELRVEMAASRIRVEVTDPGSGGGPPRPRQPSENGGWGLFMVENIAQQWGVEVSPTRVWFEIATVDDRRRAS